MRRRVQYFVVAVLLTGSVIAGISCGGESNVTVTTPPPQGAPAAAPTVVTVTIGPGASTKTTDAFGPPIVVKQTIIINQTIVQKFATVIFVNTNSEAHTATADDGSFDTGIIPPGGSAEVRITKVGEIPFHCEIHPNMRGVVNVLPADEPSPTPSPTVSPTPSPTVSPTPSPTVSPSPSPTVSPTPSPEPSPTDIIPTNCEDLTEEIDETIGEFTPISSATCQTDAECVFLSFAKESKPTENTTDFCTLKCGPAMTISQAAEWATFLETDSHLNQLCQRESELNCSPTPPPTCGALPTACENNVCVVREEAVEPSPSPT